MFNLKDFIDDCIMPILSVIFTIFAIISLFIFAFLGGKYIKKTDNYIQNLEEKLNIYERSYEEYCLEDSINQ